MQVSESILYQPSHLANLFDRIVGEYWINEAFSFGLTHWWRKKAVDQLQLQPGDVVADLMCGTGENWRHLNSAMQATGQIKALDFSRGMLEKAHHRAKRSGLSDLEILEANALSSPLDNESLDAAICSFGLKTLRPEQMQLLAQEILRTLKPGGRFALLELTLPTRKLPRLLHQFHFNYFMHPVARLMGLAEEPLVMLDTYLHQFDPPEKIEALLRKSGMEVQNQKLFGGFACLFFGEKPRS